METPDTYNSLFFGYSAIWLLVVFFVVRLMAGQKKIAAELTQLKTQLRVK